jgi:hypothetical protein
MNYKILICFLCFNPCLASQRIMSYLKSISSRIHLQPIKDRKYSILIGLAACGLVRYISIRGKNKPCECCRNNSNTKLRPEGYKTPAPSLPGSPIKGAGHTHVFDEEREEGDPGEPVLDDRKY